MSVLSVVLPAVLLLAALGTTAGARGVLRRNHLFGIRIPSLLLSDEAWREGHRAATAPSWVGFAITAGIGLIVLLGPLPLAQPLTYLLLLSFVATVVVIFVTARRAAYAVAAKTP